MGTVVVTPLPTSNSSALDLCLPALPAKRHEDNFSTRGEVRRGTSAL